MIKEVGTHPILLSLHFTPVAVVSLSHGPGGLPSVLGRAQTTGHNIDTEGGLAGVVSLDLVLPLGLSCQVFLLAILHPQTSHASGVVELKISTWKTSYWQMFTLAIIFPKPVSHNSSSDILILSVDYIDKRK